MRLAIPPDFLDQWPQLGFGEIEIVDVFNEGVFRADGLPDAIRSNLPFVFPTGNAVEIRTGLAEY